ncbi:protein of unknown function [Paenibacillaceae bacterium GAS479]|nr:protein of unknown function [Paenibacillaceae bacterium GAS479]
MTIQCGLQSESFKLKEGVPNSFDRVMTGNDPLFAQKTIRLATGRRDWAAFQVLLQAKEPHTLSVGRRPAFSPYGALPNYRLAFEMDDMDGLTYSMNPIGMVEDDDGIHKADILLHDEVIHVMDRLKRSVWCELRIPEEAPPGIYKGNVHIFEQTMFEDERKVASLTVELEVINVVVPEPAEYSFQLELWQHNANIARKHEVTLWSDEHFAILENYVASLGGLGQKSVTVIASEIPWSGQGCFRITNYYSDLFEYSMIGVEKSKSGTFLYDFNPMERYIQLCAKHGISSIIDLFGLSGIWQYQPEGYGKLADDYPDGIRVRYLDRNDGCYKYMRSAADIKEYIAALHDYFETTGRLNEVRIMTDEPSDPEAYRAVRELFAVVAPGFQFKTCYGHMEPILEAPEQARNSVVSAGCLFKHLDDFKELKVDNPMWYVACDIAYPNTFIHSHLLESRLIPHLTAFMGFDGFLRWNYTVWPDNPRERIRYKYPFFSAGDTNFVYPGNDGRPLLTLRYMNLRRGIQEFELTAQVKQRCHDAEGRLVELWSKIIKAEKLQGLYSPGDSFSTWFSDEHEDYEAVRKALLEMLVNA